MGTESYELAIISLFQLADRSVITVAMERRDEGAREACDGVRLSQRVRFSLLEIKQNLQQNEGERETDPNA